MYHLSWWCGVVWCLALLFASTPAIAQNLDEYLKEIKANNPEYRAAHDRWQSALEQVEVASTLPDPKVTLGIFAQEVETRVGPQKQRLGLSQAIPWKGKLAFKRQRASEMAEKANSELMAISLKLATEFKTLFAELYYIGRSTVITSDHLKLLKDLEGVITERYETNAAHYNDLIRIQIEIDGLTDRLMTLQESANPVVALMNALLGRPVHQEMSFPESLPDLENPQDLQFKTMANSLPRQNPILLALDHQTAAERVSLKLAKKDYFPDFKLGLDWVNTGSAVSPISESGKDAIILSVGINLPVWRKKYSAAERSAVFRVSASEQQHDDTQAHLEANLKRALFKLNDANRKIRLYEDQIIPKAEESLSVVTSGFQTGNSSYLDLIESEKALLEFLLSLSLAKANQLKAVTAIEAVLGKSPFEKE